MAILVGPELMCTASAAAPSCACCWLWQFDLEFAGPMKEAADWGGLTNR